VLGMWWYFSDLTKWIRVDPAYVFLKFIPIDQRNQRESYAWKTTAAGSARSQSCAASSGRVDKPSRLYPAHGYAPRVTADCGASNSVRGSMDNAGNAGFQPPDLCFGAKGNVQPHRDQSARRPCRGHPGVQRNWTTRFLAAHSRTRILRPREIRLHPQCQAVGEGE
jgi:hypothetical protein